MTSRLLPFLSLVAAVGIFFAYINPLWTGQIAQEKAAIASDDQALASANQFVKRENELATQMNAIDPSALSRLETFLPDSVDNVGLILDLNALAARSGVEIDSVDVAGQGGTASAQAAAVTDGSGPVGSIDMLISAKGTYDALVKFLQGVELSERLLDVTDLTVNGSTNGVYTYQMSIRIYWLR